MAAELIRHAVDMGLSLRGAIHVGAHHGQEVGKLSELGCEWFHLVEANPDCCAVLQDKFGQAPHIRITNKVASDTEGPVTFHIASFDQSSSVLEMKYHHDIHPGIASHSERELDSDTLDGILSGEDAAKYNLLCIDVQGAEKLVLKGAGRTLANVDAVVCEVSNVEVYAGSATVEEIDALLFDQGFLRVRSSWRFSRFWGDALYMKSRFIPGPGSIDPIRRGCVVMSDLTRNGRYANQLFQYLFLLLYSLRAGCGIRMPHWPEGAAAFDLPDHARPGLLPNPKLDMQFQQLAHLPFFEIGSMPRDFDVTGYFQGIPEAARGHRDFVRRCFRFKPEIEGPLERWIAELTDNGCRPLVAAHLRRGDYTPFDQSDADTPFVQIPTQWAFDELERIRSERPDARIVVATDDAQTRAEAVSKFGDWPMPDGVDGKLADFHALSRADVVLVGNSSYSFFASFLADDDQDARIVDFGSASYLPFDAWCESAFWARFRKRERSPYGGITGEGETRSAAEQVAALVANADRHWLKGAGPRVARFMNAVTCEFEIVRAWALRRMTRKRGLSARSYRGIRAGMNRYWKDVADGNVPASAPAIRFFFSLRARLRR